MPAPNAVAITLIIVLAVIQSVLQALGQQSGSLGVEPHALSWITIVLSAVAIGIGVGLHYLPSPTQTATNMSLKAENETLKSYSTATLEAIVPHGGQEIRNPEQFTPIGAREPTALVDAVGKPQP